MEKKKKTIQPRHVFLAIANDEDLNKLVAKTTISASGVIPNINGFLFAKQGKKGAKAVTSEQLMAGGEK